MRSETKKLAVLGAFAAIYLIWGSTYLAIRIGLETLPPFLLAGSRFAVAGVVLYLWLRLRGVPTLSDEHWWSATVTGILMLVCGVGGVTWAEQTVPSGVAALLVTTVPLWMTVIDSFIFGRSRRGWPVGLGLAMGFVGVAILLGPSRGDLRGVDPVGAAVIVAAALFWSLGSLWSRRGTQPKALAMTVAVQMITAGVVLLVISSALREWQQGFLLSAVSGRSMTALAYLAVFGSMVSLCAYVWLLQKVPAPAVATYAFVNPAVAVFLGWTLAGEMVGPRVALASVFIVGAVALIQWTQWTRGDEPAPAETPLEPLRVVAIPSRAVVAAEFSGVAMDPCEDAPPCHSQKA